MSNNNERLAAIIAEKLKEKGLIRSNDEALRTSLAKGSLNETEWKITIEEVLNTSDIANTQTTEENETE